MHWNKKCLLGTCINSWTNERQYLNKRSYFFGISLSKCHSLKIDKFCVLKYLIKKKKKKKKKKKEENRRASLTFLSWITSHFTLTFITLVTFCSSNNPSEQYAQFLNTAKDLAHVITPSDFNRSSDLALHALRFYYVLIFLQYISIMLEVWKIICHAHKFNL